MPLTRPVQQTGS